MINRKVKIVDSDTIYQILDSYLCNTPIHKYNYETANELDIVFVSNSNPITNYVSTTIYLVKNIEDNKVLHLDPRSITEIIE